MDKNIDIYGRKYSKLTDEEKLEVLNYKIKELFVNNEDNTAIVNKHLNKDKLDKIELEIYNDLLRRKLALEEKIKSNNTQVIIPESLSDSKEINLQKEIVTNQDINIFSEEYKKLTKKEKLEIVNKIIQELFVPSSKNTMIVIYNYERKNIEKSKKGIFKDLLERKKALEKEITASGEIVLALPLYEKEKKQQNKPKKQVVVPVVVKVNKKNQINNSNKTKKQIAKTKQLEKTITRRKNQIIERKTKLEKVINNHRENETVSEYNYKTDNNFTNIEKKKIINSTTKETKSKKTLPLFLLGIGAFFKKGYNSIKGKITSLISKTSANKEPKTSLESERRRKKQRKLAFLCAGLVLLTLLPFGKANKKNASTNKEPSKETTSQTDTKPNTNNNNNVQEDNNIHEDNEEINKEDNEKTEENNKKEEESEQNNSIYLDDTVTINDNAYIYKNMYDMTYNTNAYNPYYNGTYERDIQGVVYSLNNKLYIIYETDADAASKIEELEKNNAILTGVLVTRTDKVHTGDYEGYYTIDSVKIKTRKINN